MNQQLLTVGSCFSDEIGQRLIQNKFQVVSNPFGTIYNPLSIFKLLTGNIDPEHLFQSQDVWYHWDCHGEVSSLSKSKLIEDVKGRCYKLRQSVPESDWLIITMGSAFVYHRKETGQLVANCHKVPQSQFEKSCLSVDEIVSGFKEVYTRLKAQNPKLNILLTVSPVRHTKDGWVENNVSKAVLIQAVWKLVQEYNDVMYFPSYEIMMDELRDYRFYAKDRIHPSEEAVDYIWDRFTTTFMDSATMDFLSEWGKICIALAHRPFHEKAPAHQRFVKNTIDKLRKWEGTIDVSQELLALEKQLKDDL